MPYMRWIRDILIVVLVFVAIAWYQSKDLPTGTVQPLAGGDINGQPLSLNDYKGQPVLLHFWATWCPICSLEEGSIQSISEDYPVLSVATNSGESDEIRHYMTENGLTYPVIMDASGDIATKWGIQGVPSSFIIDGNGQIRHASVGYSTEIGLRVRLWWLSN